MSRPESPHPARFTGMKTSGPLLTSGKKEAGVPAPGRAAASQRDGELAAALVCVTRLRASKFSGSGRGRFLFRQLAAGDGESVGATVTTTDGTTDGTGTGTASHVTTTMTSPGHMWTVTLPPVA